MAEWVADADERRAWLTFAIVGAGPTGVELAGQIGELAHRSLTREFRNFAPSEARILLFDAGPRILPTFPSGSRRGPPRRSSGSASSCSCRPRSPTSTSARITVTGAAGERRTVAAMTRIWAAGVRAAPLAAALAAATGAPTDRLGRITRRRGLLAARPSGDLRRRRHDGPRGPARARRGRDAVRPSRGAGDHRAAARRRAAAAVPLPRPRHDGGRLADLGGRDLRRLRLQRPHRLARLAASCTSRS